MPNAKQARSKTAVKSGGDTLADRIRAAIPAPGRSEKRMFGGTGFMLDGHMVAGTFRNELLVRVGKERNGEALRRSGARPMEMRGRPLAGYVMVDPASLDDGALKEWLRLAMSHVRTLPPKPAKSKPVRKKGKRT